VNAVYLPGKVHADRPVSAAVILTRVADWNLTHL
jgi:hypothetical protein